MEIVITRTKTLCVVMIDGVKIGEAKTLPEAHKLIKKHLRR